VRHQRGRRLVPITLFPGPKPITTREPLEGDGLAIVSRLMARPPLHCPYLFHGPRCAPGHVPSKQYACLGDFKKSWKSACTTAGLPVQQALATTGEVE